MSRVGEVRILGALASRPLPFRPDYPTAAACALAFARPLATGWITFGEVETRVLPFLAGPDWQRVEAARREAAGFITRAVDVWEATRDA